VALGRVAGIRVGVHWSVIAIWWLLTWSLSTELLPQQAPGSSSGLYWLVGGAAAVGLLACLLAHELSHALTARRQGVRTESITLWILGGVAHLRDEAPSPRGELLIAAAGPAASFAIAAGTGVMLLALHAVGAPDLLVAATGWLAAGNALLAVFNLLPGVPLDGGRVLHAWLWARSGDRRAATRRATRVGRVVAYGLIAAGTLELTAGYVGGLWLIFIGWFLISGATAEAEASGVRDALAAVRVRDVMTAHPDVAPAWVSVQELLDGYVLRLRHSSFPVRDEYGRLVGLVTLAAVKRVPPEARASTPVAAIAVPLRDVPVADPGEALVDLLTRMPARGDRRVLVLDAEGRLVGIVTPSDVARAIEVAALARR